MGNGESTQSQSSWRAVEGTTEHDFYLIQKKNKEKEEMIETLEAVGKVAALALVGWRISKLASGLCLVGWGISKLASGSGEKKKMMKASGRAAEGTTEHDLYLIQKKNKEKEEMIETLKAAGAAAALALVGWGISKLASGSGEERKMMKAPGRDFYILRDDFESDPASYFRNLRN